MKTFASSILAATLAVFSGLAAADADKDVTATFDRFVIAQNTHDLSTVRDLLLDSKDFLWVTRGAPIWGREAALKRFETLYQGTWKLAPESSNLKILTLSGTSAQLFVPIMYNIGAPGQPAADMPFLVNMTLVKTTAGWRIASILPIPQAPPTPASPVK
jgi:hypothetical protein